MYKLCNVRGRGVYRIDRRSSNIVPNFLKPAVTVKISVFIFIFLRKKDANDRPKGLSVSENQYVFEDSQLASTFALSTVYNIFGFEAL